MLVSIICSIIFSPIVHAIENRKIRERKKIVLLEGVRLIKDAMKAGAKIKALYFTKVSSTVNATSLFNLNITLHLLPG